MNNDQHTTQQNQKTPTRQHAKHPYYQAIGQTAHMRAKALCTLPPMVGVS
jgi:hypothetical protein